MSTNVFSVKAAADLCHAALFSLGLFLSSCSGSSAPAGIPAVLPMREAQAPTPPRSAQTLDDAVVSMTIALFDRARIDPPGISGRYSLVVDPLIDRATGEQSVTTRGMEQRIGAVIRDRYPDIDLRPFSTASLAERPLILLGAITAVADAGIIPPTNAPHPQTYRIWAVLGDLRTGKIVSHETAWVKASDVDTAATGFFRDSPTWRSESITAAYLKTCAGNAGDPIDPVYLAALEAQALIADGTKAYETGNYAVALTTYTEASQRSGGDQLRVRNGIYLSNRALGRSGDAEDAFGSVFDYGLDRGQLAVKFLFRPGSAQFWPTQAISGDYPMWLRQIARRTSPRDICLEITGHSSPTGTASVNQRLSTARAQTVRAGLIAERMTLRRRIEAKGVGADNPLIGTGTDDLTDALDRRVEFLTETCPMD
jgi:outer membrane protein OmpA-like peptidoglycan-associated protein